MAEGSATTINKAAPEEGEVKLFDPRFEGFVFGSGGRGSVIAFGPRGGFPPSIWIGPADHPLLEALLRDRPDLIEGDGTTPITKVYVCPICEREFKAMIAFRSHVRTHAVAEEDDEGDPAQE